MTQTSNTLWITRCPVPTATGIALNQGWLERAFAARGWSLETLQEGRNADLRLAHFRHDLTGLVREGGNIPPIWARADGADTVVVGLTWVDERQAVLARQEANVTSPDLLRGKRFGVTRTADPSTDFSRAQSLHGLASALELGGVGVDEVEIVEFEQPPVRGWNTGPRENPALDALLRGEVDVIYAKGAQGSALEREHDLDLVVDLNAHPDARFRINNGTPRPITFHRTFLQENPDAVALYLAVALQAADWARSHPLETRRILAEETGTDEESVLTAYGPDLHLALGIDLTETRIGALELQKNFLRDWDQIPGDFSVADWIDPAPLAKAQQLLDSGALDFARSEAA